MARYGFLFSPAQIKEAVKNILDKSKVSVQQFAEKTWKNLVLHKNVTCGIAGAATTYCKHKGKFLSVV